MSAPVVATARCPVCGTGLEGDVWTCERCHTPHHRDCTAYFGGCAIFGCRDGAPPARIERDLWPATVQRVGQALWMRRLQSVMLLVIPTLLVSALALVTAGPGVWQLLALTAWGGFYVSLVLYLGISARAWYLWKKVQAELGAAAGTREFISLTRMQQELRPARIQNQRLGRLRHALWGVLAVSGVMFFVEWHGFAWLFLLAMLLLKGIEDLDQTWSDIDTCLHRVESTFAPALKPGSKPPQ